MNREGKFPFTWLRDALKKILEWKWHLELAAFAVVVLIAFLVTDWLRWFVLGTIAGALVIALLLQRQTWRRLASRTVPAGPRESVTDPHPWELHPFGRYGGGTITAHPVGLLVVLGLPLMLILARPGAWVFFAGVLAVGGVFGLFLWWRHR